MAKLSVSVFIYQMLHSEPLFHSLDKELVENVTISSVC